MLHSFSWGSFFKAASLLILLYYAALIGFLYLRKKKLLLLLPAILGFAVSKAQDGNQGISQANTMIRGYFDTGTQLLLAIGGVLALVGAVKVFRVWNNDDRGQAYHVGAAWFGSCIFLCLVATIIRSFFGL